MSENWKTPSRSGGNGGNCVETSGPWHISSYSLTGETCVETSTDPTTVRVRDTKDRERDTLRFGAHAWLAFLSGGREI